VVVVAQPGVEVGLSGGHAVLVQASPPFLPWVAALPG
jgi:hypothetical protein